jgi:ribosomal protein L3
MASMLKVATADIENEERALEEEMKQRTHQIMLLKLRKKIGEIETMVHEGNVTMSEAKAAFKVFTGSNITDVSSISGGDGSAGETKTTMVETEVAEAAPTKEEEIVSVKAKCL